MARDISITNLKVSSLSDREVASPCCDIQSMAIPGTCVMRKWWSSMKCSLENPSNQCRGGSRNFQREGHALTSTSLLYNIHIAM